MAKIEKYSDKGPFEDPVVRCYECKKIALLQQITKDGFCLHCGARKVQKMRTFNEEEWSQMKKWGVDPVFLDLFADRDSGKKGGEF